MASERGVGQTEGSLNLRGMDSHHDQERLVERHGKAGHSGLEPRRRKAELTASILSTAGHVKPRGNVGGPPSKPKYYPVTDSGAVP